VTSRLCEQKSPAHFAQTLAFFAVKKLHALAPSWQKQ